MADKGAQRGADCGGRLRLRRGRWLDSIRDRISVPLSPPPAAELRGGGGTGTRRQDACERGREGSCSPRLPFRGLPRHGKDLDGEDPGALAELREGTDPYPLWPMRALPDDRRGDLARRDRDGRRLEPLRR